MRIMARNIAKCHFYIGIVKRSLKFISLTKCYDDTGWLRMFAIVLKYFRIYYYMKVPTFCSCTMFVCNCVSRRFIQQICHTLGKYKKPEGCFLDQILRQITYK